MFHSHMCRTATIAVVALAMSANVCVAQAVWPTIWEVRTEGSPIGAEALADYVEGKTLIFDIGGYADGSGYVFNCDPDTPVVIWHDGGFGRVEEDTVARIDEARVCFVEGGREECLHVMTMPGWNTPFILLASSARAHGGTPSEDRITFLKETEASRFVSLPIPADRLVDVHGEIDLGVVAYTLPGDLDLEVRGANDFPLTLAIGEQTYTGFRVQVEIIGWPDAVRTPGLLRAPGPDDDALAQADLEQYRPALPPGEPSSPGRYGERYLSSDLRVTDLVLPGGPCLRVEQGMSVMSDPDGVQIKPAHTLYARQFCVSPEAGALFAVTVAVSPADEEGQITAFWDRAHMVLNSIRVGPSDAQGR